jgi:hypothetical protein
MPARHGEGQCPLLDQHRDLAVNGGALIRGERGQ